jgi:hypothetical protein
LPAPISPERDASLYAPNIGAVVPGDFFKDALKPATWMHLISLEWYVSSCHDPWHSKCLLFSFPPLMM